MDQRVVQLEDRLGEPLDVPLLAIFQPSEEAYPSGAQQLAEGELADYHLAHAARADLCRRLGRTADARASYRLALDLARQEPERRFLAKRLQELG